MNGVNPRIMLWAAFLLGYDHETAESIRETVDWALSKKFAFAAFNVLTPYPGTAFYERMKAEGRLLYDGRWWLHDDYRFGYAAFRPKRISPDELSELGFRARVRHNTIFQILRRATDFKTNAKDLWSLFTFFAYNPIFRVELHKKFEMMLGYRGLEREFSKRHQPAVLKTFHKPCVADIPAGLGAANSELKINENRKGL